MKTIILLLAVIVMASTSCVVRPNTAPYGDKYRPVPKGAKMMGEHPYKNKRSSKTGLSLVMFN